MPERNYDTVRTAYMLTTAPRASPLNFWPRQIRPDSEHPGGRRKSELSLRADTVAHPLHESLMILQPAGTVQGRADWGASSREPATHPAHARESSKRKTWYTGRPR